MHRVYVEHDLGRAGETISIEGDEAVHALRVKRMEAGERVQLMDGRGGVAECVVAPDGEQVRRSKGGVLRVVVERVERVERVTPRVEVCTATPKGGRADEMIDQLSQVGAAVWSPLETKFGVVDPRETKLARFERIAREAGKQCGRAWVMEIGEKVSMSRAVEARQGMEVVVADASGDVYERRGAGIVRLVVGPEGGFTDSEMAMARERGARVCRFGVHVMRIETAAVVAAGVVMVG